MDSFINQYNPDNLRNFRATIETYVEGVLLPEETRTEDFVCENLELAWLCAHHDSSRKYLAIEDRVVSVVELK